MQWCGMANKVTLLSELESVQQLGNSYLAYTGRMRNALLTCCSVVDFGGRSVANGVSHSLNPCPRSLLTDCHLATVSISSRRLQQMVQMS